MTIGVIIF